MKYCWTALVMLLCFGCVDKSSVENKELSPKMESVKDSLDTYISKLTELQKFNGVVLAYKNDTLLLEKAYNLNQDSKSSTYVSVDTQFDIHSISKLMTYFLVTKLEQEGKLSMSQTLDMFFEGW